MWKIVICKGDHEISFADTYATSHEALKASFSRPVLEVLELLDYDVITIMEV